MSVKLIPALEIHDIKVMFYLISGGKKRLKKLTFSLTFSNDEGETTEKHTRNTSVCG